MRKMFKDVRCYGILAVILAVGLIITAPAMAQKKGDAQSKRFQVIKIAVGTMPPVQKGLSKQQLEENKAKINEIFESEDGFMAVSTEINEIRDKFKALRSEFDDMAQKSSSNLKNKYEKGSDDMKRIALTLVKPLKYADLSHTRFVGQWDELDSFKKYHKTALENMGDNFENGAWLNRYSFLLKKYREHRNALKEAYNEYESFFKEYKEVATSTGLL